MTPFVSPPESAGPGGGNMMMGPQSGIQPGPQSGPQSGMMQPPPAIPPGMSGAPAGVPGGGAPPPGPSPSPQMIAEFRTHIGAVIDGLLKLVSMPRGSLNKKAIFDAAAEMLAKGAFPTPESKQDLIVQLSNLPDDEPTLRKALGDILLQVSMIRAQLHEMHGPGQPVAPEAGNV